METAEAVAEKLPVVESAATVTDEGTETAELLLDKSTVNPPLAAAALSVTVQASVPEPVRDESVHEIAVNTGTPVPLRLTSVEEPVDELLASVSWPVAEPAAVGSNCTVSLAVGLEEVSVSGKVTPEME